MAHYIFGVHPAIEALKGTPAQIERVFLAKGAAAPGAAPRDIARLAQELSIPTESVPREHLDRLAAGGVHQGVVLRVKDFAYADLADVIAKARDAAASGLVLVLDGIEDPHNLGALVRSASALGAQGVVIPKDRAVGITGTVVKASAGAVAHIPVARVTNLARALSELKDAGLWAVGADMEGDRAPEQVDMRTPTALVVGSEGAGIRRGVLEKCDFVVRIPMAGPLGSLNASVAGGILLAEVARQRRVAGREERA